MSEIHFQLIAGGRDFRDRTWMTDHVGYVTTVDAQAGRETVVVEGGARGADSLARLVATEFGHQVVEFEAEWDRYGKSAGYRRNEQMARFLKHCQRKGHTVSVVLFPGGRGTEHMREIAKSFGLPVFSPRPQRVTVK